jgi:uncharacterized protein (TIGR00369 family)
VTADVPEGFAPIIVGGDFIAVNGPLYLRQVGDRVELGFRVEPRHTNGMAICHGGMMASFCDMLLPMVTRLVLPGLVNHFLPTVSLQVDYLGPSPLGAWVQGTAQALHRTGSLAFAQGLVHADDRLVARASGVFKISRRLRDPAAAHRSEEPASSLPGADDV